MHNKLTNFLLNLFILSSVATSAFSLDADLLDQEILIAPKCFIDNNSFDYKELSYIKSDNKKDFVLFSLDREYFWEKFTHINHKQDCGKFISVNNEWEQYLEANKLNSVRFSELDYEYFLKNYLSSKNNFKKASFNPRDISKANNKQELLDTLYSKLNADRIWDSLDELTFFQNRAAFTDHGYKAAAHVKAWMELLSINNKNLQESFTVEYIPTTRYYKQPSVMAVLGKDLPGKALVISAHLDTNGGGRRPGADDDGSGVMVVLEAARLISESNYEFTRPIYFIFYAAEEMGLVGSKQVVQEVIKRDLDIDSVLHFDTIGRRANPEDPTLFLLRDNVDQSFTDYMSNLIKDYVKVPVDYTTCGYACSDHASWNDYNFSATAAFESSFEDMNPHLHTINDTKDNVSLDNLVNYTKLALAYVVDKAA